MPAQGFDEKIQRLTGRRCAASAGLPSFTRPGRMFLLLGILVSPLHALRTLVDDSGRKVVVPDHAHRIICLAPSITDDVFSMGAGPDVVAVSDFTKYPAEAAQKTSIGSPGIPSLERIVALHPDIVLGTAGINRPETVHLLEQHGISVYMVNTVGLEGVYRSLQRIGEVIGREQEADALVDRLRQREAELRRQADGHPVLRVFVPLWYDPIFTIGKAAYITDLLRIIGLRSVTDDIPQEWPQISMEAVILRNPDVLLLFNEDQTRLNKLKTMPGWSTLRAVREGKVLYTDDRLELPAPVCFDALTDIAKQMAAQR